MHRMSFIRQAVTAVLGLTAVAAAHAAPQLSEVTKTVQAITGQKVVKIEKAAIPGLYEVLTDSSIFYTDETGSYVLLGAQVFTTKGNENFTEKRMHQLAGYRFEDLPMADAIKVVHGNGKRVLVTFEDPNCGFCKRFAKTVEETGNITHYVFVVDTLGPKSTERANAIWCAPDRSKAWQNWMTKNEVTPADSCATPVQRNSALARKYKIQGTPSIFFKNGDRARGAISREDLEKRLAQQSE